MRTVLRKTLDFAVQNQYIVRPYGWLDKIPLTEAHGRKIVRTELTPEQSLGIIGRLKSPLDTFALLIALLGRRGEEAVRCSPMISMMTAYCTFGESFANAEWWN